MNQLANGIQRMQCENPKHCFAQIYFLKVEDLVFLSCFTKNMKKNNTMGRFNLACFRLGLFCAEEYHFLIGPKYSFANNPANI